MTYLLDTDVVVEFLKGRQRAIEALRQRLSEPFVLSIITFAEVYEGIYYGTDPKHNDAVFRRFLKGVDVIGINRTVARRYAVIRGDLRKRGELVPQPDLLIAATAIEYDLALLTGNVKDFARIPLLRFERPWDS